MNLVDDTVVNTKTESLWMCSLVASEGSRFNSGHYLGVVGVAGSPKDPALRENPAVPTRTTKFSKRLLGGAFYCAECLTNLKCVAR